MRRLPTKRATTSTVSHLRHTSQDTPAVPVQRDTSGTSLPLNCPLAERRPRIGEPTRQADRVGQAVGRRGLDAVAAGSDRG